MSTTTAERTPGTARGGPYEQLIALTREANLVASTMALLGWDQETMMPSKGLEHRSLQLAQLASIHHRLSTDPRLGEHLAACEADTTLMADPLSPEAANVREIRHTYDRLTRLPVSLVEELAQTTSLAQHEWAEARRDSDFARFRPWLERIVDMTRRKAECLGWAEGGEPWDALAEDYEPGCTAAEVEQVFAPLRTRLGALVDDLMGAPHGPPSRFNEIAIPVEQQERFVRFIAAEIGFDFSRGRLDRSTHPFCSGTHCHDIRMTTRFHEVNVNDALGSTMHESGHGIYEQGLLAEHIGTPMGMAVSLGIHESQSRLWENQVGRSREFWTWCHPKLGEFFGDAVEGLSVEEVYGAANIVRPDFIRVEADEATYNLHIMVRFKLERAIMSGDLTPADLPGAWNETFRDHLGLEVPDDRRGCLQDIHWSSGSFGYFPTYTLGNLYAGQFFEKALDDHPDLYGQFERGEFGTLKSWLNTQIHGHGQRYRAADLCRHVTGKPLSADPLLRHLEDKLRPLYGV
jgi:carboxypeptidase Taq